MEVVVQNDEGLGGGGAIAIGMEEGSGVEK